MFYQKKKNTTRFNLDYVNDYKKNFGHKLKDIKTMYF